MTAGENARMTGYVVDDRESPVAGAKILALAVSSCGPKYATTTVEGGQFDIGPLEIGEYILQASWSNSDVMPKGATPSARVRAKTGTSSVKIVLPRGGTICGRVLLDSKFVDYFGLVIEPYNLAAEFIPLRVITTDGRFTLDHISSGVWRVSILAPHSRRFRVDNVAIHGDEVIDLGDINLVRGRKVTGYVRDEQRNAITGARVIIGERVHEEKPPLVALFAHRYETLTDASGFYCFEGVDTHPSIVRRSTIRAIHSSGAASIIRELPEGDASIDLELIGAGSIQGVVGGINAPGALVHARRIGERFSMSTTVSTSGEFRFFNVPVGEYLVTFDLAPDEPPAKVSVGPAQCAEVALSIPHSERYRGIRLTVRVSHLESPKLLVAPMRNDAPDLVDTRGPDLIVTFPDRTECECHFENCSPGLYAVSLDGVVWKPLVVTSMPEQTLIIHSSRGARQN